MNYAKTINTIYYLAQDAITALENKREGEDLADREEVLHKELHKVWDACRNTGLVLDSYISVTEDLRLDFDFVTSDWIKKMLKETDTTQRELGVGVNVSDSQISSWLSEHRNPSGAAQAAIFYFFKNQII